MEKYEMRQTLDAMGQVLNELRSSLDIAKLQIEVDNLNQKTADPDFWNVPENAQAVMVELNGKRATVEHFTGLQSGYEDLSEMVEMLDDEEFEESREELTAELRRLEKKVDSLKTQTLLSGDYDTNNCFFSIHAGTGGLEATDWAQMLQRMYERWFEQKGWKVEQTDLTLEEGGGIKSVSYEIRGYYAYGLCKSEKGVHRLVRISPFDSQSRRHTSFASVDVYPELKDTQEVTIEDKDLKIDTYRSTGAGGQHVNTTDSAVRITHIPTGVVVTCQNERSQIQNRAKAMEMLKAKLVQIREEEHREKIEDITGKYTQISWGAQIRSYVFQPYTMVKDHRTGEETGNITKVMDGDLDAFVESYLSWQAHGTGGNA
ncbi:peptide chain release factor 2 [Peptoniphilaceae bacterium SGI.097]